MIVPLSGPLSRAVINHRYRMMETGSLYKCYGKSALNFELESFLRWLGKEIGHFKGIYRPIAYHLTIELFMEFYYFFPEMALDGSLDTIHFFLCK